MYIYTHTYICYIYIYTKDRIKSRNSKNLKEAEEIKKRWQECTEELYKNVHNDRDRDVAGVTHIKPDTRV